VTSVSAPPRRRARSPRGKGDLLREEILAAAERILIDSNDQSAVSIRAIASAVGVTPPSIYLHFADRTELLFAVCERQAALLHEAMANSAAGVDDPLERMRLRGLAYLHWGLQNPEHYRILMMSRPDCTPDRFVDERLADTAGLLPVIQDLVAAGAEEAVEVSKLLWMMMHGMVSLLISKPDFPFEPAEQIYDRLFEVARRGLNPPVDDA
jgi:AcrR family transcriptional regulator